MARRHSVGQAMAQERDSAGRLIRDARLATPGALDRLLEVLPACLKPEGRAVVISFHSLEDRPVKQLFRRWAGFPESASDSLPRDLRTISAELLTRRPVRPGALEVATNPRSRSAKLRVLKRL